MAKHKGKLRVIKKTVRVARHAANSYMSAPVVVPNTHTIASTPMGVDTWSERTYRR